MCQPARLNCQISYIDIIDSWSETQGGHIGPGTKFKEPLHRRLSKHFFSAQANTFTAVSLIILRLGRFYIFKLILI